MVQAGPDSRGNLKYECKHLSRKLTVRLKRINKCAAGQQHQLTSCCQIRAIEIGITRTSGQRIVLV
jgi:hypothetical protein